MKATVLTLALLCAGAAYAQPPTSPAAHGADAARHMDDLATLLDLTDAQKAQVQTVLEEQHAKMKQLRTGESRRHTPRLGADEGDA